MVTQRIWFERPFDLNLPTDSWPEVMSRLRGAPARLEELIRGIPDEKWTDQPQRGWSIQTQVGHLLDLEALWLARAVDFRQGAPVLAAADLENRATEEADHDAGSMTQLLGAFRWARVQLVATLDSFDPETLQRSSLHPRLQVPITPTGLGFFVAEHDDHHLAAIYRLGA